MSFQEKELLDRAVRRSAEYSVVRSDRLSEVRREERCAAGGVLEARVGREVLEVLESATRNRRGTYSLVPLSAVLASGAAWDWVRDLACEPADVADDSVSSEPAVLPMRAMSSATVSLPELRSAIVTSLSAMHKYLL